MAYLTENINHVTSELEEIFKNQKINEFIKEISYYATYLFLLLTNYEDCDSEDLFRKKLLESYKNFEPGNSNDEIISGKDFNTILEKFKELLKKNKLSHDDSINDYNLLFNYLILYLPFNILFYLESKPPDIDKYVQGNYYIIFKKFLLNCEILTKPVSDTGYFIDTVTENSKDIKSLMDKLKKIDIDGRKKYKDLKNQEAQKAKNKILLRNSIRFYHFLVYNGLIDENDDDLVKYYKLYIYSCFIVNNLDENEYNDLLKDINTENKTENNKKKLINNNHEMIQQFVTLHDQENIKKQVQLKHIYTLDLINISKRDIRNFLESLINPNKTNNNEYNNEYNKSLRNNLSESNGKEITGKKSGGNESDGMIFYYRLHSLMGREDVCDEIKKILEKNDSKSFNINKNNIPKEGNNSSGSFNKIFKIKVSNNLKKVLKIVKEDHSESYKAQYEELIGNKINKELNNLHGIVKICDYGILQDYNDYNHYVYSLTEKLDHNLQHVVEQIQKEDDFSVEKYDVIMEIIRQIIRIVKKIHDKGYYCIDLKPANIVTNFDYDEYIEKTKKSELKSELKIELKFIDFGSYIKKDIEKEYNNDGGSGYTILFTIPHFLKVDHKSYFFCNLHDTCCIGTILLMLLLKTDIWNYTEIMMRGRNGDIPAPTSLEAARNNLLEYQGMVYLRENQGMVYLPENQEIIYKILKIRMQVIKNYPSLIDVHLKAPDDDAPDDDEEGNVNTQQKKKKVQKSKKKRNS